MVSGAGGPSHTPLRLLVGSLAAGVLPAARAAPPAGTVLLDLGPEHPTNAGLIELRLWTESGVVRSASVVVGAMHRGAEKLFEVRDYRQILMLADRHDWQAPFSGELVVALAAEQLLGLTVPDRAVWLRTQTRRLTGNRIHPMANRIGGLGVDPDSAWLDAELVAMDRVQSLATRLAGLVGGEPLAGLLGGQAPLGRATIAPYGVSGPAARASGVDLDLRRQPTYLAYGDLVVDRSARTAGDAQARLALLVDEVAGSADLVDACIDRLRVTGGPVAVRLGKTVRLPEGETYLAIEAPLGIAGVFLVSRGEKTPWRLKLRTPSFSNVSALEALLVGVRVEAVEAVLASIGYVVGDIDR